MSKPSKADYKKALNKIFGKEINWDRPKVKDLEYIYNSLINPEELAQRLVKIKGKGILDEILEGWEPGTILGGLGRE